MESNSDFDNEHLLDDCHLDENAMSPMSSLLIPAVELADELPKYDLLEQLNVSVESSVDQYRNGSNLHKCDLCSRSFKRKAHLQRHYRLHTGEKPYACNVCHMRFTRSERRNQHIEREHKQTNISNCQYCGKGFHSEDERVTHMSLHLENRFFECSVCKKGFEKASALAGHMQVHSTHSIDGLRPRKKFICEICSMEFTRGDHLARHQTVHSRNKQFQCKHCLKYFTRSDNRNKHEKSCKSTSTIPLPNLSNVFMNANAVPEASSNMDEVDPLAIINVSSILEQDFADFGTNTNGEDLFDNIGLFEDESQEHNGTTTTNGDGKSAAEHARMTQVEADQDLIEMGGIRQRVERPTLTQQEIDTLTCNVCNKKLVQKYHLVRHKLIHMGDNKPYKCTICNRTFARREHLKHHLYVHQKQSTKFISQMKEYSNINGSTSTSSSGSTIRNAQKLMKIEKVEAGSRSELLRKFKLFAIKYRQQTSNAIFYHDFYEKCFNYMGNLFFKNLGTISRETFSDTTEQKVIPSVPIVSGVSIKTEIVSDSDERKIKCGICNAPFPSSSHLRRHSMIHTGIKPFQCEVCNRFFTRAEHRRRHMLAVHMHQQLYECEICCKRFSRSDHMVSHFKIHHVGIKPYTCKFLCGERFDTYKEKSLHSRSCNYIPPNPDSPDKEGGDISVSDNESQVVDQMMDQVFDDEKSDVIIPDFQSHFIKTENEDTYVDIDY